MVAVPESESDRRRRVNARRRCCDSYVRHQCKAPTPRSQGCHGSPTSRLDASRMMLMGMVPMHARHMVTRDAEGVGLCRTRPDLSEDVVGLGRQFICHALRRNMQPVSVQVGRRGLAVVGFGRGASHVAGGQQVVDESYIECLPHAECRARHTAIVPRVKPLRMAPVA